jgi:UDP-N-acetyl-D-mannosaminuronate dehydrogenase
MSDVTAVVGLGEVGAPLLRVVQCAGQPAVGIDVDPVRLPARGSVDVMHICFPFEMPDFIGEVVRYIELLEPARTVINSTVAVGTTRSIHERSGAAVAHSPVRGKHARMTDELIAYEKYVGALDRDVAAAVAEHFEAVGIRTRIVSSPETSELAKLTETTYFGLLIAWAQQLERYSDSLGIDYDEVVSFYEEIEFFPPVRYEPGIIGGHCVMPNIEILSELAPSPLLDAIRWSNAQKEAREATWSPAPRTAPEMDGSSRR